MVVGTIVEGVWVWNYFMWVVRLIVSWRLVEVRVIVVVVVRVVASFKMEGKRMGRRKRRACKSKAICWVSKAMEFRPMNLPEEPRTSMVVWV